MTNTDAERVSDIVARLRQRHYLNDLAKARLPEPAADLIFLFRREREEAADIIEAQSKALAEAMVVKPLEWQRSNVADRWAAWHPWGEYEIIRDQRDQKYRSPQFNAAGAYWSDLDQVQREIGEAHEKRVMSILSASPQSNPGGI